VVLAGIEEGLDMHKGYGEDDRGLPQVLVEEAQRRLEAQIVDEQ
jgi:hypothetical protein